MCFDDDEPVPTKRVAPCGHDERFTDWEDHGKPIVCLKCEIVRLTQRLAAAEQARDIWAYEKDEALRQLAAAEALAANRYCDIERLESELEQSRNLFKTANKGMIRRTQERDAAIRVARDYKTKYDEAVKEME